MVRNIDVGLLRTFIAVVESGSLTGAANRLHVTQGAVSQQVKRLESLFDKPLIDRSRHGALLTAAGERLMLRAQELVRLNDELLAHMGAETFAGAVRLGVPHDLIGTHLPWVLKSYTQAYPDVDISLISDTSPELLAALSSGRVDLALVEMPAESRTADCLAIEPLVWAGCPGGRAHAARPLPLSVVSDSCAFRNVLFAALHDHGVPWRTVFENGNVEATLATVRMDLAVTVSLASTVPPDLEVLASAAGLPPLPDYAITLHLPEYEASAATQAMATHIRDGYLNRYRPHAVPKRAEAA